MRRPGPFWLLAGLVLLLGASPAVAKKSAAKRMDAYLERCATFGWSGAVLVARKGKIVHVGAYGLANRETEIACAKDTRFEIASATKPITAIAILRLEELGKLKSEDPITKHLPGVPSSCADITIDHLMTHTSGMPRSAGGGRGDDLEAAVRGYFGTPRKNESGSTFEYWNGGYALLAGIVEQVSGRSYMDFVREHVFEPAGMKHSGFNGDTMPEGKVASGYGWGAPTRTATEHPYQTYGWQYRGMGGLVTTVEDLWRLDRALRADKILTAETRDRMYTVAKGSYARGWRVHRTRAGHRRIEHGGSVRGFLTDFIRYPDEDGAIFVLSNTTDVVPWELSTTLENMLFGDELQYQLPPKAVKASKKTLKDLTGVYELDEHNRLVLEPAGNTMRVGVEGPQALDIFVPVRPRAPDRSSLRPLMELGGEIIQALLDKDGDGVRSRMLPSIPSTWPETYIRTTWRDHLKMHGKHKGTRVLGARRAAFGNVHVPVTLEHAKGESHVLLILRENKLSAINLKGPRFIAELTYVPTSKTQWETFAWGSRDPPRLLVEKKGSKVIGLSVVDAEGGVVVWERKK